MAEIYEPKSVTMTPQHWATVDAYAKSAGYGTTSAALRRIVDEWKQFRLRQMPLDIAFADHTVEAR